MRSEGPACWCLRLRAQAYTPLLLWSSRAGPARCCLLLRALTGAGYTGPDDLRLLAEDSLNTLEQYTPQQVRWGGGGGGGRRWRGGCTLCRAP